MAFTILSIDSAGGVFVSFDVDNLDQHISGLPVHNRDDLILALQRYEEAYCKGLQIAAPLTPHKDVNALIGKAHT